MVTLQLPFHTLNEQNLWQGTILIISLQGYVGTKREYVNVEKKRVANLNRIQSLQPAIPASPAATVPTPHNARGSKQDPWLGSDEEESYFGMVAAQVGKMAVEDSNRYPTS